MQIELRHLRMLLVIEQQGSLSRAAGRLGLSQPAMTTALHRIERQVGGALFERDSSGVRATELGRYVLGGARGVLAHMEMLWTGATARRPVEAGTELRVACPPGPLPAVLGRALSGVLPGCRPAIRANVTVPLCLQLLRVGQLDLAIVPTYAGAGPALPDGLAGRHLVRDEAMTVLVAAGHRLAGHNPVGLGELAHDEWIVDLPAGGLPAHLHAVCAEHGFRPRIRHHAGDPDTVAGLLAADGTVALLDPLRRVPHGAVRLPLLGAPLRRGLLLVWRRDGPVTGREPDLAEALREAHGRLAAAPPG